MQVKISPEQRLAISNNKLQRKYGAKHKLFTIDEAWQRVQLDAPALFSFNSNSKVQQNSLLGVRTAEHTISEGGLNCTSSTPKCREYCLGETGMLHMYNQRRARELKSLCLDLYPEQYFAKMRKELANHDKHSQKIKMIAAARINVLSDRTDFDAVIQDFPGIQFYDYTKHKHRIMDYIAGRLPKNLHLTASWTEYMTIDTVRWLLSQGVNVAVPFIVDKKKGDKLPKQWHGMPVFDGVKHDYRPNDPVGQICGLEVKALGGSVRKIDAAHDEDAFFITDHEGRAAA